MNVKICLLNETVYEFSEDDVKTITFIKNDVVATVPEEESEPMTETLVGDEPAIFEEVPMEKPMPISEPKVAVVPTPVIEKTPEPVPEPKTEEISMGKPVEAPVDNELESRRSQFLERMVRLNKSKSEFKAREVSAEKSTEEKNGMINLSKISSEEREAILRILNPPVDTSNDVSFKEY